MAIGARTVIAVVWEDDAYKMLLNITVAYFAILIYCITENKMHYVIQRPSSTPLWPVGPLIIDTEER